MLLKKTLVEKPWGRTDIDPGFVMGDTRRIGEIWYQHPSDHLALMIKYLFTSAPLSIQVHPGDIQAQAMGHAHGKDECWYILDAEPGAQLAIGTKNTMSPDVLRSAAQDGTIEQHMQWHDATPGHVYEIPSGTVHAIGAGITLIEVQQNIDLTYRLYDYGSARELHVEQSVAVAKTGTYPAELHYALPGAQIVERPHYRFCVQSGAASALPGSGPHYALPIAGEVRYSNDVARPGDCILAQDIVALEASENARYIVARAV